MSKLLLHTCCGPCSIYCVDILRKMNIDFEILWYNPNIHPYKEYEARRNTLIDLYKDTDIKVNVKDEYGLIEFCRSVVNKENERCIYCYNKRIEQTVIYAKENGFDSFTTTLLISPYQNHELLKQVCEKYASKYKIEFKYIDFRQGFRQGQDKAREFGIYMQKYCGCIYSEQERYQKNIESDKERFDEKILEKCLPNYLENDLRNLKDGKKNKVSYLDCLINELQGSINSAYVDGDITEKQCDYLYKKYIRMEE